MKPLTTILYVNYEYPPIGAGAGSATRELAKAMGKKGVGITVLTSAFGEYRGVSVEEGIEVCRVPAIRIKKSGATPFEMVSFVLSVLMALPRILDKVKPDAVVVFFSIPCGPIGVAARILRKTPYILMLRGGDVPGSETNLAFVHVLLRPVRRFVCRNAAAIIANSQALRNLAIKADPMFTVHVVPNGVDTDLFTPDAVRSSHSTSTRYLFAGRVCRQKNIGFLIDAFMLLQKENSDTFLTIIGDGPEKKLLQKKTSATECCEKIKWVDWCDKNELRAHLRDADCCINPSHNEGMSNVILEAMACAVPVIAGNNPSSREIIEHGKNGLLFIQEQVMSLKEMMTVIATRNEWCRDLGKNARTLCMKNFTWDASAEKLMAIIKNAEYKGSTHENV